METEPPLAIAVSDLPPSSLTKTRVVVAVYFGVLILAVGLAVPWTGGITQIPIQFFLKGHLHLSPTRQSLFLALANAPLYLGFLFGFLRDRWRHEKWGDQAYLIGAALAAGVLYLWVGHGAITALRLLTGLLAGTVLFQVVNSAVQAMTAVIAQRRLLTGWLSTITTLGFTMPVVISALAGGWLTKHAQTQSTFLIVAGITFLIVLVSIWRPREIFIVEHQPVPDSETHWKAMKRLATHWVFYIPLVIQFLWNFAPAWGTPAFNYLTDHLKMTSDQYGLFNALEMGFFLPTVLLYGFVCRHFTLRGLLWVGTVFGILQGPPIFFAHNPQEAMWVAVAFGLLGGFASAAYWDLLLRCCPKGLEGTATMMGWSLYWIAFRSSDVFGSYLYDHGGFLTTVIVTTACYVLILPVLLIIPKSLLGSKEGEVQSVQAGELAAPA